MELCEGINGRFGCATAYLEAITNFCVQNHTFPAFLKMTAEITLMDIMAAINKQTEDVKAETTAIKKEITEFKAEILKSVGDITTVHSEKIAKLEEKIEKIDERDLKNELEKRKNNIIFYKISEEESSQEALQTAMVKMLNKEVENSFELRDIDFMFRLGKKKDGQMRPVLVRFLSKLKKDLVMKNRKTLAEKKIEVADDFPAEIRARRKIAAPLIKALKEKGYVASLKVDKIRVNDEIWSLEKAEEVVMRTDSPSENTLGPKRLRSESSEGNSGNSTPHNAPSQKHKIKPPQLKLMKNRTPGLPITSFFSSPTATVAPKSPIIIVKTPSKNTQIVDIKHPE